MANTKYYRLMLGKGSRHAEQCLAERFIGADYGIERDLSRELPDSWRQFNAMFIPVYQETHPEKTKVAAGLACGMLWTVCKGMSDGDIVLCPDGTGCYRVGEISGPYHYESGQVLPHRRPVRWLDIAIDRSEMSSALRNSAGSIGAVCNISDYAEEIKALLAVHQPNPIQFQDPDIENPVAFVLEKHLEDFLVANWVQTELGRRL